MLAEEKTLELDGWTAGWLAVGRLAGWAVERLDGWTAERFQYGYRTLAIQTDGWKVGRIEGWAVARLGG